MRPLALELTFDPASDERLGRVWSSLSALYGRTGRAELGIRPHITLALFREQEPRDIAGVAKAATSLTSFRLELATVDRFPGEEGVIFLRPEVWQPHCTMAIGVPQPLMEAVFSACDASGSLCEVEVQGVQVVRYRPATEVCAMGLRRRGGQER